MTNQAISVFQKILFTLACSSSVSRSRYLPGTLACPPRVSLLWPSAWLAPFDAPPSAELPFAVSPLAKLLLLAWSTSGHQREGGCAGCTASSGSTPMRPPCTYAVETVEQTCRRAGHCQPKRWCEVGRSDLQASRVSSPEMLMWQHCQHHE